MTKIIGFRNAGFGVAQERYFLGKMVSMPTSELCLSGFGSSVSLKSNEALVQTIRKYEQLELDNESLVPISANISDDRIKSAQASSILIEPQIFGASLLISTNYEVNTAENISAISSKLLADWSNRLKELLTANFLKGSGIKYIFNQSSVSAGDFSLKDAMNITVMMERNKVARISNKMSVASTQVSTSGVSHNYVAVTSAAGKGEVLSTVSGSDIQYPQEMAGLTSYENSYYAFLKRPQHKLYYSSELHDESGERHYIVLGNEAYITVRNSPLSNSLIYTSRAHYTFNLHCKLSARVSYGISATRNERVVIGVFNDA